MNRRATAILCMILVGNLHFWSTGCGTAPLSLRLPGMLDQVLLTGTDAVSTALAGTALEGAKEVVVDYAAGTFRIVHPDDKKTGHGRMVLVDGVWAISEFTFNVDGSGATLTLDPATKQVTSVTTTEGDRWTPSQSASARSADRGDAHDGFTAANSELLGLEASLSTKNDSSFVAPLFFFIAFYWLLCADAYLWICPGFGSIFALFAALLPLFAPPAPGPTPPANNPPNARADAFTINQGQTATGNVLLDNGSGVDTDADGDALTVSLVSGPTNGVLALQPSGAFTYTPTAAFSGADTFDYQISDGRGGTSNATVTITVLPNGPPLAINDDFESNSNSILTGNLFVTNGFGPDTDPDGDVFTVIAVDGSAANFNTAYLLSSGATLTVTANGSMTYNPIGAFIGFPLPTFTETFTYTISDGKGGTSTATVSINLLVNNP
jgi:hypothetical protein